MFYEERCIDGRWEYRTTPTGEWRPGRWQESMTAPDSVERVVAEMRERVKRNGVFAAGGITEQWAARLQALARGPQQAGGEDGRMDADHWAELHRLRAESVESRTGKTWRELAAVEKQMRLKAEAALREAGRDAERLDWLDGFAASSHFTISEYFGRAGKDRYVEIQDEDDAVISEAPTLRESIDKAMAWWEIKLREDAALNGGQDDA